MGGAGGGRRNVTDEGGGRRAAHGTGGWTGASESLARCSSPGRAGEDVMFRPECAASPAGIQSPIGICGGPAGGDGSIGFGEWSRSGAARGFGLGLSPMAAAAAGDWGPAASIKFKLDSD